MRKTVVAATQFKNSSNIKDNILKAEELVVKAAEQGAHIILLQELFESLYFCQEVNPDHFDLACEAESHPTIKHFAKLAKKLNVVLPISFFEKSNNVFFNSLIVIDADGTWLDVYRKTHIPDDPGYFEKYYFSPGDSGFKVWHTKFGKIGIGICWDQWYPEAARCMALNGAEILFYPTAIGTSPTPVDHWQTVMRGHAAANMIPVVASNRIGVEKLNNTEIDFYGRSFITDNIGMITKEGNSKDEIIITHEFDLDELVKFRREACCFRDRRPECYGDLLTLGGHNRV
ncbi:MAG: N-carbamoylputrescine amidase [Desulfobacterales bacterium]|nr:N-carbamoylputrescine amidase [Desulfobacterales bacterium]